MNIIDAIRLIRKHLVLLLVTPLVLAGMVVYLTRNPVLVYSSETTLYTGIASGSSIEMDKSFSFFANNTAFDNLINIIKSRETEQEVAIRLLAQHLMLQKYDPRYISASSYDNLKQITPKFILSLVVDGQHLESRKSKSDNQITAPSSKENRSTADPIHSKQAKTEMNNSRDSSMENTVFSFSKLDTTSNIPTLPASINKEDYELTVKNLENYMASSDTNFVYRLLYFDHPHYSIKALSTVNAQRIGSSDLIKLKFDSDDPGICQQTLAILTEVCIKNYKFTKENRSDAVVKYFEYQLKQAAARLKVGEDKLLKFNEDNNIINYYEQSKAVANVKENLDNLLNEKRIKLAGTKAAITRIEEKLGNQQNLQLNSVSILEKRNQLSQISSRIATIEVMGDSLVSKNEELIKLKNEAEQIKDDIRSRVGELYRSNNSTEGLPISNLLVEWINNVIVYEDTRAGIDVLGERIKEFQKQYAIYAPAGANLKRIEREISVSEQEFLEILHGLNLANLKVQDAELSSTIKATDPPFYPLSPNPTKRKFLIIAAGLVGFLLVLSSVFVLEYFDDTLRNIEKAGKRVHLKVIGIFPKIILKVGSLNFTFVTNRLLELIVQQIELYTNQEKSPEGPQILLFISSLRKEGRSVIAGNIARKLKLQGKRILFISYSPDDIQDLDINHYKANSKTTPTRQIKQKQHSGILRRLLGYPDNRINPDSPFLQPPATYLSQEEYTIFPVHTAYYSAGSYKDLTGYPANSQMADPDFVLIELPPILYNSYPPRLVASASMAIIIGRANRVWSTADQKALDQLMKITKQPPLFILNGVETEVIESVLGDLPKERSGLRRLVKKVVRMQFSSQNEF